LKSKKLKLKSGKLTYYTSPPAVAKVSDTKIITHLSPGFDIDALLREESVQIEKMDDTKVRVDGHEVQPMESFKVNFEELEKDQLSEEEEEDSDEEESDDGEEYELNDDESEDEEMENGKNLRLVWKLTWRLVR